MHIILHKLGIHWSIKGLVGCEHTDKATRSLSIVCGYQLAVILNPVLPMVDLLACFSS